MNDCHEIRSADSKGEVRRQNVLCAATRGFAHDNSFDKEMDDGESHMKCKWHQIWSLVIKLFRYVWLGSVCTSVVKYIRPFFVFIRWTLKHYNLIKYI